MTPPSESDPKFQNLLNFWSQFGAKTKKSPSQVSERAIKVIRLGFEPKTHSLEGNGFWVTTPL